MTKMMSPKDFEFSRRNLLKSAGALVVAMGTQPIVGSKMAQAKALGSKIKPP